MHKNLLLKESLKYRQNFLQKFQVGNMLKLQNQNIKVSAKRPRPACFFGIIRQWETDLRVKFLLFCCLDTFWFVPCEVKIENERTIFSFQIWMLKVLPVLLLNVMGREVISSNKIYYRKGSFFENSDSIV